MYFVLLFLMWALWVAGIIVVPSMRRHQVVWWKGSLAALVATLIGWLVATLAAEVGASVGGAPIGPIGPQWILEFLSFALFLALLTPVGPLVALVCGWWSWFFLKGRRWYVRGVLAGFGGGLVTAVIAALLGHWSNSWELL